MPETFSQRLKTLRKKAGLNQTQLAEAVGVSLLTLFRWEKGERQPRLEEIKSLAKALNVSENDLLNDPPPEKSGDWVITFKIADKFTKEEINLTGNVQPITSITATPAGCAFTIQADWDMLSSVKGLERLFKRIMKETYPAMRSNGVALGGLPKP